MDLGNPFEVIVHYLLIKGMTNFSHEDEILMVNTLVYMVIHWTKPLMSHKIGYRVVMISQRYYNI